jgi:hypothetical protein
VKPSFEAIDRNWPRVAHDLSEYILWTRDTNVGTCEGRTNVGLLSLLFCVEGYRPIRLDRLWARNEVAKSFDA